MSGPVTTPDLLDPSLPDSAVDAELRRLGMDPVALGERGEAFAKLARENAKLVEKILALQAVERAAYAYIDWVANSVPLTQVDPRYRSYCKALAALAKVRP